MPGLKKRRIVIIHQTRTIGDVAVERKGVINIRRNQLTMMLRIVVGT